MNASVMIISEPSALALALVENLIQKNCRVFILAKNVTGWLKLTEHINKLNLLIINSLNNLKNIPSPDYFLIYNRHLKEIPAELSSVRGFYLLNDVDFAKENMIFPNHNLAVIVLSELFGPRMEKADWFYEFNQVPDRVIFPIYIPEAARLISRWLFAFGPYGEVVYLRGEETMLSKLGVAVNKRPKINKVNLPMRTIILNYDLNKALKETNYWFACQEKKRKFFLQNKPSKTKDRNPVRLAITFFVFVLLLPVFLQFLGIAAYGLAFLAFKIKNIELAQGLLAAGVSFSGVAQTESNLLKKIFILSRPYEKLASLNYIFKEGGLITVSGLDFSQNFDTLVNGILGKREINFQKEFNEIQNKLESISLKTQYLVAEAKEIPFLTKNLSLAKIEDVTKNLAKISSRFPDILGEQGKKTYLIMFQNNMELRPTGGFIGSFAILSFEKGKMTEFVVNDVYSADGQLKGHVNPPPPIIRYLNEANWYLRDSNWDPDFTISAQKAEWFLNKEMDLKFDGVIAVDLNLVKRLLEVTGPIYLKDYDLEITADNVYEKTQAEVEEDFFPGSIKKASFLSALSSALIFELQNNSRLNKISLARIIYESLEEKHFQIFLHDEIAQNAINDLNWNGGVSIPTCSENCFADWYGLVEANLGVSKANYFIHRNYSLNVAFNENNLTKTLKIIYENRADLALGNKGIYKVYLRLLTPPEVTVLDFGPRVLGENDNFDAEEHILANRKETGVYFEVAPKERKEIMISWRLDKRINFKKLGEYRLLIRKQAGLEGEPYLIDYELPPGVFLTEKGGTRYNTTLTRDFNKRLIWKNTP